MSTPTYSAVLKLIVWQTFQWRPGLVCLASVGKNTRSHEVDRKIYLLSHTHLARPLDYDRDNVVNVKREESM